MCYLEYKIFEEHLFVNFVDLQRKRGPDLSMFILFFFYFYYIVEIG